MPNSAVELQTQPSSRVAETLQHRLLVFVPFLLLFWINQAHHTLFFDEVNAWAISAASPNLRTLFHLVHYEGHPWLWYFILWFPSRLTHDPAAMKWVEAALGTAVLGVVGMLSPFTSGQRVLIFLGYFLLWEYTVMNRMYSVMFLLALIYAWRRAHTNRGLAVNAGLLGLMANTDVTGLLLSTALLLEYAYTTFRSARNDRDLHEWLRHWSVGAGCYLFFVAVSVYTLFPAPDISWQSSGKPGTEALGRHHILRSVGNVIAGPWWPINPQFPHRFWETDVSWQPLLYLLVPVILFAYWRTFRKQPSLVLLMSLTILFAAGFADVVYIGRVRHWGITFIAFLLGLWWQSQRAPSSAWSPWAYGLLTLSAIAGVTTIASSWHHPFSNARTAAKWVEQNQSPGTRLIGAPDVSFASLAEEMQRPVYFMECRCVSTFKLFSRNGEDFGESEWPARILQAMDDLHTDQLIFVTYRPLNQRDLTGFGQAGLASTGIAAFPGADMKTENYFLYNIRQTGAAPQT